MTALGHGSGDRWDQQLPRASTVDAGVDLWRRRRRHVRIAWGAYWMVAGLVAGAAGLIFAVADSFSFGFAAWLGTLMIAGLGFLPVWLIGTAFYRGAQAATVAQAAWRDRRQAPPAAGGPHDLRF